MGHEARHPLRSTLTGMSRGQSRSRLRWLLASLGLALLLAQQATSALRSPANLARLRPRSFIITPESVGGLEVRTATFERAVRTFGPVHPPAVAATFASGSCRLDYRHAGLALYFARLETARSAGTPATCTFFFSAIVTTPAWRTKNGLRVGARLRALLRRFPKAFNTKLAATGWREPSGSTWWWLIESSRQGRRPILVAYVKHGRVVGLGINMVGH